MELDTPARPAGRAPRLSKELKLRLAPDDYAYLESWAIAEHRKLSGLVRLLLRQAIARRERRLAGERGPAERG